MLVYEAIDGQIEIRYRDRVMRWTDVIPPAHPDAVVPPLPRAARARRESVRIRPRIPGADHPWRRGVQQFRIDQQLAADRKAHAAVNP